MVFSALVMTLFSLIFHWEYPELPTTLLDRYFSSGIMLFVWLVSFRIRSTAFPVLLLGLLSYFTAHIAWINWYHQFHFYHFLNFLIGAQLMFWILRSERQLTIYLIVATASIILAMAMSDDLLIGDALTISVAVTTSFGFNYLTHNARISRHEKMKRVEAELRQVSLVAKHSINGVMILSPSGQIEWVNASSEGILGYSAEQLLEQDLLSFFQTHSPHPQIARRIMVDLQQQKAFSGEVTLSTPDDPLKWLAVQLHYVREQHGKIEKLVCIFNDITVRKAAQSQLIKAKEAAEAAAIAKAEFLANMSHEIRTPMNAVIGLTGLLQDTALAPLQREFVETIQLSGENLLTVINDILDYSKIDSGKMELEALPFEVSACIEGTLQMLSGKAAEKGIELLYLAQPGNIQTIIGDRTRVSQVLVNLINNALKFTPEGEVLVRVKAVARQAEKVKLLFSVQDFGIGIPADRLDRLFQSFSQVDASTTRKYGGTGLGLAICKQLVQLMGGTIWVESEVEKGTTFFFTIWASESPTDPQLTQEYTALASRKARILLLSEHPTQLHYLEELCTAWQLQTVSVQATDQVRSLLAEDSSFDLVLAELHMSESDRISWIREIRTLTGRSALPFLFLTHRNAVLEDQEPFTHLLSKPIRQQQLFQQLQQILLVPPTSQEQVPPKPDTEVVFSGRDFQVLLVEDNLINQKVAARILEKLGLKAEVAGNGLEAIDALSQKPYDLLLMDMQMPEMDGLTASRKIRQQFGAYPQGPLIIAMTANVLQADKIRCLEAGMNDYLSKPIQIPQLEHVLKKWLLHPPIVSENP